MAGYHSPANAMMQFRMLAAKIIFHCIEELVSIGSAEAVGWGLHWGWLGGKDDGHVMEI